MAWGTGGHGQTTAHKQLRKQALRELEYMCAQPGCNQTEGLELDHIRNVARGGKHTIDNAQWLCKAHHKQKTNKEKNLWQQRYKRAPQKSLGS